MLIWSGIYFYWMVQREPVDGLLQLTKVNIT